MPHYLDVASWARRDTFEFFLHFDKPYFNVCTTLDVTNLLEFLKSRPGYSVSLAYHYFAVRAGNEIEPFRYRLKDGGVLVYDVIHGGTTVLLPNEAFILAYFDFDPDFDKFMPAAQRNVNEAIASAVFSPGRTTTQSTLRPFPGLHSRVFPTRETGEPRIQCQKLRSASSSIRRAAF